MGLLEKRRNDFVALALWLGLAVLTIVAATGVTDVDLTLEDWVVILLPWAAGVRSVLQLLASLLRQVEMWTWLQHASGQVLPLAWMYRTMTRGEKDEDGLWLRDMAWDPHVKSPPTADQQSLCCSLDGKKSFQRSASRKVTMTFLVNEWRQVLTSATMKSWEKLQGDGTNQVCVVVAHVFLLSGTAVALCICILTCALLVLAEYSIMTVIDYLRWLSYFRRAEDGRPFEPIPRYDTLHLGTGELKILYEQQRDVLMNMESEAAAKKLVGNPDEENPQPTKQSLARKDILLLHDRIMAAVTSVSGLLENAFRRAYLVTPTYKETISSRKVLRSLYASMGIDIDIMIKTVRRILELRNESGLLSLASRIPATGTIEAALHDNIEALLTVTFWMSPRGVFTVGKTVAALEAKTLNRASKMKDAARSRLADVVAIDTRNFVFWLLWLEVAEKLLRKQEDHEGLVSLAWQWEPTVQEIERLYVIASFLSRCRYTGDTNFDLADTQEDILREVQELVQKHGNETIIRHFRLLSRTLQRQTGRCLLTWAEVEHSEVGLAFLNKKGWHNGTEPDLMFTWSQNSAPQVCPIAPTPNNNPSSSEKMSSSSVFDDLKVTTIDAADDEQPSNITALNQAYLQALSMDTEEDLTEVSPTSVSY